MSSKQTEKQQAKTIGERLAEKDIIFGQGSSDLSERETRKKNAYQAVNERHQSRLN